MLKKILLLFIVFMLSGCNGGGEYKEDKIKITATLFPQYDFAREIVKDRAEVSLLMPAGIESHSYEPAPMDIINIEKSDIFIYTGKYMEPWAENIIKGVDKTKVNILDISKGLELDAHGGEHYAYDPHIWTSPVNAMKMVDNILDILVLKDSKNAEFYKENAQSYKEKLGKLDSDIRTMVMNSPKKNIVFGGRFAMNYFAKEYGLYVKAAYHNCSHETEPSIKLISDIITTIKNENISVIYYEELTEPKVARMVAEETGVETLLLHSCHNLSKEDFEKGESYLSLMEQNLNNLKRGLN